MTRTLPRWARTSTSHASRPKLTSKGLQRRSASAHPRKSRVRLPANVRTSWRVTVAESGAPPNVRYGSLADIGAGVGEVCFTHESGHAPNVQKCPLSASSRHPPLVRTLAVRLVTFGTVGVVAVRRCNVGIIPVRRRSAGIIAVRGRSVGVVAFRRRSARIIADRRWIIADCGGVGVRGRRHIVAICWRVIRVGHRIPISPVITSPVANVLDRRDLNVCIAHPWH